MKHNSSISCDSIPGLIMFVLMIVIIQMEPAYADSCGHASVDTKVASASRNKYGYFGCQTTTPPTYYLVNTVIDSFSASDNGFEENVHWSKNSSLNTTQTYTYDRSESFIGQNGLWTAPITYAGSGKTTYNEKNDNGYSTNESATATPGSGESLNWSDNGHTASDANSLNQLYTRSDTPACTHTIKEDVLTGSFDYDDGTWWEHWFDSENNIEESISGEYTDEMLRSDILSMPSIQSYPSLWSTNTLSAAYYHLTSSDPVTGSCQKMKYRIHLEQCIARPNATYRVHWDEVTTYDSGGSSTKHMQETIHGTADPMDGVVGSTHEINVPSTPSSITIVVFNPPEIIQSGSAGQ